MTGFATNKKEGKIINVEIKDKVKNNGTRLETFHIS